MTPGKISVYFQVNIFVNFIRNGERTFQTFYKKKVKRCKREGKNKMNQKTVNYGDKENAKRSPAA